ncbi:MAG: WhiB family transcriptional regulator [Actinophytocola sp.]|nr:WhiB family transcriptional regulator [Actinophytocola sp.]
MTGYDYDAIVDRLHRLRNVPDDVLWTVVTRDGLCFWAFDRRDIPLLWGVDEPDRALAEFLCAGCPVMDDCLELELRKAGPDTIGVWGAMAEQHRRELYPRWQETRGGYRVWQRRHPNRQRRWGGEDE